ncbi:lipopolysaccharide transport periplasmic protein LptA [Solilutibacter silvestris]|uniref:Lipopolysaccharide transport periplasmic protein LptA n=1 Tax=Solilutibacter silvestris TaxID=1645665 RepID=A0A2K1Q2V7_9GAMM|nr:lipopolysaccharide transport periplasmic protein LptA [Lysobacter silvestris]PNS09375.1 lipopolysaccharide transport periplasmic protein LptA [Lysobacter silvestris]
MPPKLRASLLTASLLVLAVSGVAVAKTSDRKQPTNIEADQGQMSTKDDTPSILDGNVSVVQGTMTAKGAHGTVWSRKGKAYRMLMTGSPVVLTEILDDGSPMKATAANVDYNLDTDIAVFTGNVVITQPKGTLNSEKVTYNMKTGTVNSGGGPGQRVHMVLQPKSGA